LQTGLLCYGSSVSESAPGSVAALVRQAHAGERTAEATICRRFVPVVRAFARRRLRSADAVEEFAQDVLLLLVEALRQGRIEQPERLGGFVLGICKNVALDRARQRERRESLWQSYGAALESTTTEAASRATYEVAHLEDCLSQLSRRSREVLRLGYIEARAHDEVAAALEISEANARVLRHRTLASLRECMNTRMSWETA
jgi:RNA polymerase sigma-70 factor (ECF subfamily)